MVTVADAYRCSRVSHRNHQTVNQNHKPSGKMIRTGRDLTFLLTGIAAGSLVGLLYAPDKGKITRDRLSFRLSKYREQINQLLDDLSNSTDLPENSSKNEGQRVVNDAREKAERLLEDVDKLMAQIKQQNA